MIHHNTYNDTYKNYDWHEKKELADSQSMLPLEDDKEEFVAMPLIPHHYKVMENK